MSGPSPRASRCPCEALSMRVRAAKSRAAKYEVRDDVVSGLALAIQPTGVRTYFLARMARGRRRYATIGSADLPPSCGRLHR